MADAMTDFLREPDASTFERIRAIVLADPNYSFYSTEVDELVELAEADARGVGEATVCLE